VYFTFVKRGTPMPHNSEDTKMQTITVIIRDNHNSNGITYADPLIYTVQVVSLDDADVLHAVSVQRAADIGCSISELDLNLLMAFPGDLTPCADYRE
jgi:hypothetical protein